MAKTSFTLALLRAACALALAGCGQKPAPPPPPAAPSAPAAAAPDIAADTRDAALTPRDQPNLRVCLSQDFDKRPATSLAVPAGVIFVSWGRRKGDERNPDLDSDMLSPGAVRWAVVTARPFTLSKAKPCAEVIAHAALSGLYEWRLPLVRKSQDLQFAATGVENHMAFPLTGPAGEEIKKGLIFGYPTADIGNPKVLREDE